MRKLYLLILSYVLLLGFAACSDSDFSDKYVDPSTTSTVTCEKLMTGVFVAANTYIMPSYDRYFSFETQQIGRFAQTMGFINEKGMYLGLGESYNNNRWTNFYNLLSQYRLLESTYDDLEDAQKDNYTVTLWLAQIIVYEQLEEVVDLWGDAPFTEAGYLAVTSDLATSYPSYDTAESIYEMMLDSLGSINTELANFQTTTFVSSYLSSQDYINGGDLTLWQKLCNSLRLRIAMRASTTGDLTSKAQSILKEMLADATTYPLVDSNDETINVEQDEDGFNYYDEFQSGLEDWDGACNRASQMMVSLMDGDPRIDVLYDKTADGVYVGLDTHDDESTQQTNFDRAAEDGGNYYSAVDTATFSRNASYPGIIMTAAEVSFIKAEAFQKGYASGDAEEAFIEGVTQSINYYYYLNELGDYRDPVTKPSDSEIEAFAEEKWSAYDSKEEAIATQKWIHFGIIQMVQAWSEVRRTGYPELYFQTDNATSYCSEVPDRLTYPTDELDYNTAKYNEATNSGDTDTYYNKLFWAK